MSLVKFVTLFKSLENTRKTNHKKQLLVSYFKESEPSDLMWGFYFLCGEKVKSGIGTKVMREALLESTGLPEWLFKESHASVGDLCETIALLSPNRQVKSSKAKSKLHSENLSLQEFCKTTLIRAKDLTEEERQNFLISIWESQTVYENLVVNKMFVGSLRLGVAKKNVVASFAEAFECDKLWLTHKMMGGFQPNIETFQYFTEKNSDSNFPNPIDLPPSQPYPFALAHPIDEAIFEKNNPCDFIIEWKYDGIRAQVIKRKGEVYIWSRGEEEISHQFPDIVKKFGSLPDGTVVDGEILGMRETQILPFGELQKRLGRKKPNAKLMEQIPCNLVMYDLLEWKSEDLRSHPLKHRREKLNELCIRFRWTQSTLEMLQTWQELREKQSHSRSLGIEGFMLKHLSASYPEGRKRGYWWKWKVDPMTVDCVLLYAQSGSGRRAGLFTDYTLGIWDKKGELTPIAKAYSGLNDAEIKDLNKWILKNTTERFGPVRKVRSEVVIEIAFEDLMISKRHKSGFALRFPRIKRLRTDKKPVDANHLGDVEELYKSIHRA